jgi:hypothetical protein
MMVVVKGVWQVIMILSGRMMHPLVQEKDMYHLKKESITPIGQEHWQFN